MKDDVDSSMQQLIDAAREERGLSPQAHRAGLERLRAQLGAAVVAGTATALATKSATAGAGALVGAKWVIGAGAALALGAALYAVSVTRSHRPVAPPALSVRAPVEKAAHGAADSSVEAVSSTASSAVTPSPGPSASDRVFETAPGEPRRPRPAPSGSPPPNDSVGFEEDARLLRDVHAALGAGRAQQALAMLDARRRRPGAGALGPEREAARIVTLCRLGRGTEASKAAARFLELHAGSPLAARVRQACP